MQVRVLSGAPFMKIEKLSKDETTIMLVLRRFDRITLYGLKVITGLSNKQIHIGVTRLMQKKAIEFAPEV